MPQEKQNDRFQYIDHLYGEHAGFREHVYPALLISETTIEKNPNYHSSVDDSPFSLQKVLANAAELLAKCLRKDKPDIRDGE